MTDPVRDPTGDGGPVTAPEMLWGLPVVVRAREPAVPDGIGVAGDWQVTWRYELDLDLEEDGRWVARLREVIGE